MFMFLLHLASQKHSLVTLQFLSTFGIEEDSFLFSLRVRYPTCCHTKKWMKTMNSHSHPHDQISHLDIKISCGDIRR